LAGAAAPWYGAYLECAQGRELHAALSLSPELFLEVDAASGEVTTRPIKGTRPGEDDPETLRGSAKDQAELNMIVDLMRNILGACARRDRCVWRRLAGLSAWDRCAATRSARQDAPC